MVWVIKTNTIEQKAYLSRSYIDKPGSLGRKFHLIIGNTQPYQLFLSAIAQILCYRWNRFMHFKPPWPAIFSSAGLSDDGRARVAVGQAIKKQKLLLPGGRFSYLSILNLLFIWSRFFGSAFRGFYSTRKLWNSQIEGGIYFVNLAGSWSMTGREENTNNWWLKLASRWRGENYDHNNDLRIKIIMMMISGRTKNQEGTWLY